MSDLPKSFLDAIQKVTAKRAKTVIDHILAHGHITTEELKDKYGYHHPPRAARDVREQGIPLETFSLRDANGRSIGAYRFADVSKVEHHKLGGRQVFSKNLRKTLHSAQNERCGICYQAFDERYLQVDHRVPYEVAGDTLADESDMPAFLFICASCQRSKSWSCEHCLNWKETKDITACRSCYWASPESYTHIALQIVRREVLIWTKSDIDQYERISQRAAKLGLSVAEYVKRFLDKDA